MLDGRNWNCGISGGVRTRVLPPWLKTMPLERALEREQDGGIAAAR